MNINMFFFISDPNVIKKTGKILIAADLADEYGFTDIDGK